MIRKKLAFVVALLIVIALVVAPAVGRGSDIKIIQPEDTIFLWEEDLNITGLMDFGTILSLTKLVDFDISNVIVVTNPLLFDVPYLDDENLGIYHAFNGTDYGYSVIIDKPELELDIVLAEDNVSSVNGKSVSKNADVIFKIQTFKVGDTYFNNTGGQVATVTVRVISEGGASFTSFGGQNLTGILVISPNIYTANIDLNIEEPGTYTALVEWTSPQGFADSAPDSNAVSFTVLPDNPFNSSIIANFTAAPLSGFAPLEVQFNDTTTGDPTTWNWSFGDGNTSTVQYPTHIYTVSGNYSVSLTVSNGSDNNTVTKEQYIRVEPLLPNAELIFNINHNRGTTNDSIASGMSLGRLVYFTGIYNPADSQDSISGDLSFVLDAQSIIALIPDTYVILNGTRATWQFPPSTAISPGETLSTTARTSVLTPKMSGVTLERICNRTTFTEAGEQLVTLHLSFDTVDLDGLWGRLECSETADVRPAFIQGTISTNLPLVITTEESNRVQFNINHSQVETGRQYTLSYAVAVDPTRTVVYAPSCAIWEVTDAAFATAPPGTSVSLPASLLPENVSQVTFSSNTLCQWSCSRNYHIVTSISQRADPSPAQPAGVTINSSGGLVHAIGDEIVLSGYNSASSTTYLFLTGPNLPTNGASLNNFMPAVTNVTETFTTVDVDGNNNWNYSWGVWGLDLVPGSYMIFAASEPKNLEDLGDIPNASIAIELINPTLNATISTQTILQGEKLNISGTATGDPFSIAFWILGTNYVLLGTETVSPLSDSFDFQIDTHWMSEGRYTVILQHPGKNALFDTYLNWSNDRIVEDGTGNYFVIHGPGSLQSNEAIAALLHMLNESGDDLHTILTFDITDPNPPIGEVPGSAVTITVPGDRTGCLGDIITLSGTNTVNNTIYLSILGPNLPVTGGKLEDPQTAAISGVPSSFTAVIVEGQSWQYRWDTTNLDLDGIPPYGTNYTLVAAAEPKTADELNTTEFASVTVRLLTPAITEMHPAVVAKGDNITIEGVATGSPFNVLIWIIGPDFRLSSVEEVDPEGSVQFTLTDTAILLSGEYYVIAQHPMLNGLFDVYPVYDAPGSLVGDRFGNYFSFDAIDGPGATETRDALLEMLQSPYVDEAYAYSMFSLDHPWISVDPISNTTAGEPIIISGTTNLAAEDEISIDIISQKTNSTVSSGIAEISAGNFSSTWLFELNTTSLQPDAYSVFISSDDPYAAANSSFIVFGSVNLEDPIVQLHFNEGTGVVAHDSSGNENDGTVYGATWVDGISGKALDFNGSTDYLDLGNLGLSTSTGTIETWIYPRTIGCCKQIFSARSDDNQNNVQLFLTGTTDIGFYIAQNGSPVVEIYNPLTANHWHHVVITQDGMTSRMFIDGELQEDFDSGEWFDEVYGLNEYAMGRMRWMSNYYFDGIIDEFSIYPRALSPEDVQTHYLSHADNLTQAPVADFAAYPLYGNAPLNVSFIDLSSGYPTNWSWDVEGDGIADYSIQNVTHTYTAPGTYSVSLTVSNDAGTNTTTKTGCIAILEPCLNTILAPGDTVFIGETGLDLTASMGGFSTAAWYEPGRLPGVDVPSNIYSVSPGATNSILSSVFEGYTGPWYQGTTTNEIAFLVEDPTIDIQVMDASTGAIVNNASITEGENKLNFQIDSNLFPMWLQRTSCDGDGGVYIFVRTPEGAVLNALINDNGTVQEYSEIRPITAQFIPPISDSNATVHWDTLGYAPGMYMIWASTNVNGMEASSPTHSLVILSESPLAQFTASLTSGPAPLAVTFNDTSTGDIDEWNWSFGDGTYSTEKDPAHVYTEPGIYSVTLKVSNPLGNSTKNEPELITVEPGAVGGQTGYYLIHSNIDGASVYFTDTGNETYYAGEIENGSLNATVYLTATPLISYTVEKEGYLSYTGLIETPPAPGENVELPSKLYSAYSQLDFEVPGVTIVVVMNGETRQYIEIDPSQFTLDSILIEGDDVIIADPELQFLEIVYHLSGIVVDQNISGYLEGADFTSPALSAMLEDGETVEPSFALSFDLLPENGSIGIGILEGERTEEAQSFFGFADSQGTPLDSLKYVVEVDSASLGGELGGVYVYFRADLDWVETYGKENVKIYRCDNTGSITVLATEVIETTETAVIFQGYSPDGLSVFAIAAERPPTYDSGGDSDYTQQDSQKETPPEIELPQDALPEEEPPIIEPELISELPVQQIPEQLLPQTEPLITESHLTPADALISEISRISSITPGDYFAGLASSVETATKTSYVQSPVAQALPKEACPVAAVATGIGVAGLGAALTGTAAFSLQGTAGTAADAMMGARVPSATSQMARAQQAARPYVQRLAARTWRSPGISQRIDRVWEFIRKFLGFETIGYLGLKEVQWRKILPRSHEPIFFGLSYRELAFAGISIGLLATAFTFAGRLNVSMTTVFLFILMGAIAVIGHELITNIIARQNQCDSEFRMWGLGALILFANAGLFGLAFGKPSRTLVAGTQHLSDRDRGMLMLIGPLVNVIFALISLYLIPLGGLLGAAGAIGFPINIMLGLYVLIPVHPMKGKVIFQWNRLVWAVFFIPLVILYISVYYLF